jgi:hypothetical protein
MKVRIYLFFLIFCFSIPVFGAQIYGSLKDGENSVPAGTQIEVKCGENPYSGKTDDYSAYSIFVKDNGKCAFKVFYNGKWSLPFDVYSAEEPVRYDFVLEKQGENYVLLRR